ncbi:serine hydrolase [Streptomyces sp. WM6386]|uniref:serine hydrolase n=1 Tax=Streptomyces sp. WM6386 TaxID=1415558 RepID=UPI000B24B6E7|nr:serine hydrolase [Streptomyces sp. WM6386]
MSYDVRGTVADGFEGVREEFAAFVAAEAHDPGAQLAAYVGGRQVVDLWAGKDISGSSLTTHSRTVRVLGPASSGGVGNARGVARMYAAAIGTVDGRPPLLTPATVAAFAGPRTPGTDLVTGQPDHFGLGFESLTRLYPFLGTDTIGHSGATGSLGFADPGSGVAYAYTRRRFAFPSGEGASPENGRLAESVVRAARAA